jgi:uncharacterized protein (DUF2252 family)
LNIVQATRSYETWAQKHIDLVDADLELKHDKMAEAPLPFLRATFYRWAPLWRELCADLSDAPTLLAVGDLHIENFGTWRDAEGRLVWGVNDFDEAFPMPYVSDLVRLAVSALLAAEGERLAVSADEACAAILDGYGEVAERGRSRAFVLEESHTALRAMALSSERDPARFWGKMMSLKRAVPPRGVEKLLRARMPRAEEGGKSRECVRFCRRIAGLGSLGRPRYVALADWRGGLVAREAKAMLPSAYAWATGARERKRFYYNRIVAGAARASDPFLYTAKGWLLRRLSPHCLRIDLNDFPKKRDEIRILKAMGEETANVHFGMQGAAAEVRRDLRRRPDGWLNGAARKMAEAVLKDWEIWRNA